MNNLDLNKRLTSLEIKFEERWSSHDELARERFNNLDKKIDIMHSTCESLLQKFNDLPCSDAVIKMSDLGVKIKGIKDNVDKLWTLVIVVIILGIALGIWVKLIM